MNPPPVIGFLPILLSILLFTGCAATHYLSLGTYYVDEPRAALVAIEPSQPDTVALLSWSDTLEVLDAPLEKRTSEDLFLVRRGGMLALAPRDLLISDILFRSKYTRGRPVRFDLAGKPYFEDEFGERVAIRFRGDAPPPKDTVIRVQPAEEETQKKPARRAGKRRRR